MVYLAQAISCSSPQSSAVNKRYAEVLVGTGGPAGKTLHFREAEKAELHYWSCVVF